MVNAITVFPKSGGDRHFDQDINKSTYGIFQNFEQETLSVTNSDGNSTYSAEHDYHIIQNIGSTPCFLNFDEAATTNDFKLEAYDEQIFELNATDVHAITSAGVTVIRMIGQS